MSRRKRAQFLKDLAISTAALLGVIFVDFASNQELMIGPLFAIPVVLAGWRCGLRTGLVFAGIASYLMLLTPTVLQRVYETKWLVIVDPIFTFCTLWFFAYVGERLRRAHEGLLALSRRDSLTLLANRVELFDRLEAEMTRHRRRGETMTVMFIDCDNFKMVNDQHGHSVGDKVLKAYADRLRERLRAGDVVARYGGDEFVVVLPETGAGAARELAEVLKARLESPIEPEQLCVRCSIGVGVFDRLPVNAAAAIAFADSGMYEGKRDASGGIIVRVYSES